MTQTAIRARIAWLSAAAKPAPSLRIALDAAGYVWTRPPRKPVGGTTDLALVDVRRAEDPVAAAKDLLSRSGVIGTVLGVVIIAPNEMDEEARLKLFALGDVCRADLGPRATVMRIRDRLRLAQLAEESGDRLKSAVAAGLDVRLPSLETSARPRILFAGAPGPLALSAIGQINDADCAAVFTAGQALRAANAGRADAAVLLPSERDDLMLALARSLKRNRRFAGAPMFALTDDPDVAAAFGLIGVETLGGRQVDAAFVEKAMRSAKRARLVASLRGFLRRTSDAAAESAEKNASFFAGHAGRLSERAGRTGRPFSLIGIALRPDSSRGDMKIAEVCAKLCRAEDMALPMGRDALVIIAPSTYYPDAMKIAARAAGVLAGRSDAASAPELAAIDALEWKPGDTPQELVTRLFAQLRAGGGVSLGGAQAG